MENPCKASRAVTRVSISPMNHKTYPGLRTLKAPAADGCGFSELLTEVIQDNLRQSRRKVTNSLENALIKARSHSRIFLNFVPEYVQAKMSHIASGSRSLIINSYSRANPIMIQMSNTKPICIIQNSQYVCSVPPRNRSPFQIRPSPNIGRDHISIAFNFENLCKDCFANSNSV
jgi:hypothetical protein